MEDLYLVPITIYHKVTNGYQRYNVKASFRNTTTLNKNNYQLNSDDSVTIRIFDKTFENKVDIGDIIVNKQVNDTISESPQVELRNKYGKNNVFKVNSKSVFLFDDKIGDIEHIRLECV